MSRKRGTDDQEDPYKRQRRTPEDTTQLTQFRSQMEPEEDYPIPQIQYQGQVSDQEIRNQLTQLGEQISLAAERERNPEVNQRFLIIRDQLLEAFDNAFEAAQTGVVERQVVRQEEESKGMEQEETRVTQSISYTFQQELERLTSIMSGPGSSMTPGEQVRIYNTILEVLRQRIDAGENIRQTTTEPDQLNRLSQLTTAIYNGSLQMLSTTLTNLYNSRAQITRQTVAIITSSLMLYNYQPQNIRSLYENIPYFGVMFRLMNSSNQFLRILTNSGGTLTTIYYLLRNAGFENLTNTIVDETRQMASNISNICQRQTQELGRRITQQTTTLLCNAGGAVSESASHLLGLAGRRLGALIHENYQNIQVRVDDSSESSQSSEASRASQMAVQNLLETPIEEGGISINQNEALIPQEIIEQRFEALVSPDETNDIIEGAESVSSPPEQGYMDLPPVSSQGSEDSELTQGSQGSTTGWNYPPNPTGGRRLRKSRRNMKLGKTRHRKRKGRRGQVTRKGKRHYKTMKRHRQRMRK